MDDYELLATTAIEAPYWAPVAYVERSESEFGVPWPISGDATATACDDGRHVWAACDCSTAGCAVELCVCCEARRDLNSSDIWRRFSD